MKTFHRMSSLCLTVLTLILSATSTYGVSPRQTEKDHTSRSQIQPDEIARWDQRRERSNRRDSRRNESFFWDRQLTRSAFAVGTENNQTLYSCRVSYQRGIHPGKLIENYCNFGFGGQELRSSNYEVLSYRGNNSGYRWVRSLSSSDTAIVAGQEATGENLFLCRASYRGGIHPGKLVKNRCNIGFQGQELQINNYEILISDRSGFSNDSPNSIPNPQNNPFSWSSQVSMGSAFPVGSEYGQTLYSCRVSYQNGIHPGKLVENHCNFSFGGEEIRSLNYQILSYQSGGLNYRWQRGNRLTNDEWVIGGQEALGTPLYICRGFYNDSIQPGKLVRDRCNIGFGGREIELSDYEILVLQRL